MSILIGADLVATPSNRTLFAGAQLDTLLGEELLKVLRSADFRMFNLEAPLTDTHTPIPKCGPCLAVAEDAAAGYAAMGIDLLTLGNNHIMDHGVQGLHKTQAILQQHGIAAVGVGDTPEEANAAFFFTHHGKKVGVYACAEREFSIVTEDTPGANPFDPLQTPDDVQHIKAQCDYLIVLYHGGKEYYRYPSAMLQQRCRKMAEKGADLVVCQHSHCIGCHETYAGSTIVYGQGNFLFDGSNSQFFQTGMLVKLDDGLQVSYIPLVKQENTVRLATGKAAEEILEGLELRSRQMQDPAFLQEQYRAFAREKVDSYLLAFSGLQKGIVFRLLNKLTRGKYAKLRMRRQYNRKDLLTIRNYVECECHAELLLEGLKERGK